MKRVVVKSYGRWVSQYRHAAEKRLGRKLSHSELVHHINRDPSDNRPENLMIVSHAEHSRLHRSDIQQAKMKSFYRRQEENSIAEEEDTSTQLPQIDYATWLLSINDLVEITGIKKSYFMKHISAKNRAGGDEENLVIPHFFKLGGYRCTLESFLEWLEARRIQHVA